MLVVILKDYCLSVVKELKKIVSEELKILCVKLCKCLYGFFLYGNDYDSMKDFDFGKVWFELKMNFFFLVEFMNVVFGKENFVVEIKFEF